MLVTFLKNFYLIYLSLLLRLGINEVCVCTCVFVLLSVALISEI